MRPEHAALAGRALQTAPLLLGTCITSWVDGAKVVIRLTELEAYEGTSDPGSHGFRGPTARNASLFGPPGTIYCYFTYGMHYCANIVCGTDGMASACLMRAGTVLEGQETAAARRRNPARARDLANGPAKLAQALGLDKRHDGAVLGEGIVDLSPVPDSPQFPYLTGPRVGVAGPGGTGDYPWRFWLPGEESVSVYRAAAPRRPRQARMPGQPRTPAGPDGRGRRGASDGL